MKNLFDRISNFLESWLFPSEPVEVESYYEWLKRQPNRFENVDPKQFNEFWENLKNHTK